MSKTILGIAGAGGDVGLAVGVGGGVVAVVVAGRSEAKLALSSVVSFERLREEDEE